MYELSKIYDLCEFNKERGRRLEVLIRQLEEKEDEQKLDSKEDKHVEEPIKAEDQADEKGMVTEIDQIIDPRGEKISKIEDNNGEEDTQGELEHDEAINSL